MAEMSDELQLGSDLLTPGAASGITNLYSRIEESESESAES